ncbi:DNA repair protein RadC [Bacillus coahuilensis m2-6]|uniref:DNA repair protein RadC n=1 Tax=Bacillus coahuilensis p1.1.43 TaxID=1150625 RepID=A0A147K7B5_9BACI|nr:DNA repair protein RadC [Bacillus coahuilensis p1.1.43]KUP06965.1 DNA repair protein RadC [Bacillus coahuilensis m2-6]
MGGKRIFLAFLPNDPTPSREDIEVTKRLVECGKIIGIEVLDHLIIGEKKYVSLKEKGYI